VSRRSIAQAASAREAASSPLMYSSSSIPSEARPAAWSRDQEISITSVRTSHPTAIVAIIMILHPGDVVTRDNASSLAKETGRAA